MYYNIRRDGFKIQLSPPIATSFLVSVEVSSVTVAYSSPVIKDFFSNRQLFYFFGVCLRRALC